MDRMDKMDLHETRECRDEAEPVFRLGMMMALGRHPLWIVALFSLAATAVFVPRMGGVEPAGARDGEPAYETRWEEREFTEYNSSCMACHETLSRKLGRPVRDHVTSAHFRASVTCHECHGGDPEGDDEEFSHDEEMGFVGKLNHPQMLKNCGSCHVEAVEQFKAGEHGKAHEGVRRLTCLECHGAHNLGAGARPYSFTWVATCADCHELENVKALPENLAAMMAVKDDLYATMTKLREKNKNKPYPPEVMESFREVRQLSADIVHPTLAEGYDEALARIVERTQALNAEIAASLGDE